jgi:hypothetical protein
MIPGDCLDGPSGRKEGAGDVGHRQDFLTPSEGSSRQPSRRLCSTFGPRRDRLTMPRIAAPAAPSGENLTLGTGRGSLPWGWTRSSV